MTARRAVLGGLLALAVGAGGAQLLRSRPARVLFVGNSFLRQHDVPGQVAALAIDAGRPIRASAALRDGARLAAHAEDPEVGAVLGDGWDALVLQDHSTVAISAERRAASAAAVAALAAGAPGAALVLVVPWARAAGHALYAARGTASAAPWRRPDEMTRDTAEHLRAVAAARGAALAPVAQAFADRIAAGRGLHAADGHHANPEGAALAAAVIWQALDTALAGQAAAGAPVSRG